MSRSADDFSFEFPDLSKAQVAERLLKHAASLLSAEEEDALLEDEVEEPEACSELFHMLLDLESLVVFEDVRLEGSVLRWTLVVHDDLQEYAPPEARDHDFEGAVRTLMRELGGQTPAELAEAQRAAEHQSKLKAADHADTSPEGLLAALEAIDSLRVLDRVFLDDFRMQVHAGTSYDAQRARAVRILEKHGG